MYLRKKETTTTYVSDALYELSMSSWEEWISMAYTAKFIDLPVYTITSSGYPTTKLQASLLSA